MTEELWLPIFDSKKYLVSNLGRVKTLNYNKTKQEAIMKPFVHKDGVEQIALCENGKVKRYVVSKLVAIHFIPNPNNLHNVIHKDGTQRNEASNLEWSTSMDNHF